MDYCPGLVMPALGLFTNKMTVLLLACSDSVPWINDPRENPSRQRTILAPCWAVSIACWPPFMLEECRKEKVGAIHRQAIITSSLTVLIHVLYGRRLVERHKVRSTANHGWSQLSLARSCSSFLKCGPSMPINHVIQLLINVLKIVPVVVW